MALPSDVVYTIMMVHTVIFIFSGKPKEEEKDETNHVEALHKKKERIFRSQSTSGDEKSSSGAALPPPTLPAPGKCFDVYIAMAANPCNFVVSDRFYPHVINSFYSPGLA